MLLTHNGSTNQYILRVPRGEADPQTLMREYGLDFSAKASRPSEAILYTPEPYAAAAFALYADDGVKARLAMMLKRIEESQAYDAPGHFDMPVDKALWGFQRADMAYLMSGTGQTLDGDDMGLGKTEVAIVYANTLQARRVLVICPANIRRQWYDRIREWSTIPNVSVSIITTGANRTVPPSHAVHWTVMSYDLTRSANIRRGLAENEYDLLILDEAHYAKTIDSKRTRAIFGGGSDKEFAPIMSRCARTLALTGTPLLNRPREAYTLARGLCWDAIDWASEDTFRERFNPSRRIAVKRADGSFALVTDEAAGRFAELQNRMRANFMCRHSKHDPEIRRQIGITGYPVYDLVVATETAAVKQALAAERLLDIDPETFQGADGKIDGAVATVRREMGVALAPQVAAYVRMLVQGGEAKIVVFYWHIEVGNILEKMLDNLGVVRIDGSTANRKPWAVNQFRTNPQVQIFLGNMLTAGVGTDGLQHVCNHCVIAEPDWVPGNNQQALDRIDRGGQTRQVQGDIFVAPDSFAERVLASALRKMRGIHAALDRRVA